jgi:serine/threonine protein kinase
MNITKSSQQSHTEVRRCPNCDHILPPHAQFCGTCGKRITSALSHTLQGQKTDIHERYRITSLVRRQSYVQMFLAVDTQEHQPVMMRDIDITSLPEQACQRALTVVQQEYDLLRRLSIPDVMPLIDQQYAKGHLYSIAQWPFAYDHQPTNKQTTNTLDDLLQSGIGLPGEEKALTWTERLAQAIASLHEQRIVLGDLDPHTIVVSGDNYDSTPALSVFWLPRQMRPLLKPTVTQPISHFMAPEARQGYVQPCSDVYSLGAILYLLLTGLPPVPDQKKNAIPAPHEINNHISNGLDELVMRALNTDPLARFAHPTELAGALRQYAEEATLQQTTRTFSLFKGKREGSPGKPLTKRSTRVLKETLASWPHATNKATSSSDEQEKAVVSEQDQSAQQPIEDVTTVIIKAGDMQRIVEQEVTRLQQQNKQADEPAIAETDDPIKQKEATPDTADETPTEPKNVASPPGTEQKAIEDISTVKVSIEEVKKQETPKPISVSTRKTVDMELADAPTSEDPAVSQKKLVSNVETEKAPTVPAGEPPAASPHLARPPAVINPSSRQPAPLGEQMKKLITGPLPALPLLHQRPGALVTHRSAAPASLAPGTEAPLVDRLRRFVLGRQQYNTAAAALIETPLRVQPHQSYLMRIKIMGRDTTSNPGTGLSGLVKDDVVHIEVRSALFHKYAYIVQQAEVQLPGQGYAAAITIPLQPLSDGPSGRRERLHIHFMDKKRNPLYEKPFAVEIFISPLVQAGREGHNVLPIPL